MNKILTYIGSGRGTGLLYLFILSLAVSLIAAVRLYNIGQNGIPYAQEIADQMLPIRVSDGVIVDPLKTYRRASLSYGSSNIELPIVLDTTRDTMESQNLSDGIYITRTAVYTVTDNQVKINRLSGSIDLPRGDYREAFRHYLNYGIVFFAVVGILVIFLLYGLLAFIYAFCADILGMIMKRRLELSARMRLAAVSLIAVYLLFIPVNLLGLGSGGLFLLVTLAFEAWLLRQFPAAEDA